jgi:formate dehydrogenase subunit delta
MDIRNLVKMANQIGDFFESYSDQMEASAEISSHLKKFWAPRMRECLLQHVDATGGEGLSEIVLRSVRAHRGELERSQAST